MPCVRATPCLFLSYDQSSAQIVRQWIAQEYGVEARRQRQPADFLNTLEQEQCYKFADWLDKQPLQIIKCGRQGVKDLCGYIRSFRSRHKSNPKTAFVVIDHIGKVSPRDSRLSPDKISGEITVELKAIAEHTKSAVLVLNQRNSFGTKRDNPRPIAADLYGGEGARADYDAVLYLYRAEKYRNERAKIARPMRIGTRSPRSSPFQNMRVSGGSSSDSYRVNRPTNFKSLEMLGSPNRTLMAPISALP